MPEFKLIFDECLSSPVLESLKDFLEKAGVELTMKGVVEHQRSGIADKDWIPRIAAEGNWIVISCDRGKRKKGEPVDEKLPYLCRKFRVTHVLLSGSIHAEKSFVKGHAIVAVWRELRSVGSAVRGTRFQLKKSSSGNGYFMFDEDTKQRVEPVTPSDPPSALSRNGFRVNRRGFALIWKSDNALVCNLAVTRTVVCRSERK